MSGEHLGDRSAVPRARVSASLVAAGLAATEGIAFLALGVSQVVAVRPGGGSGGVEGPMAGAVAGAVFFWVCAAGLGWSALGLLRGHSWSRGPLLAAQLLLLAIAWTYRQPYPGWAAVLAAGAGLCLVLLAVTAPRQLADRDG
ncbi:MAG: hypothetical protein M3Q87_01870 [Actinomycetota bacterium]|nr:hypothetical protein [Actinomycetota bacterium]